MGAKGAVEIIFRGKDVVEREKEYTELFCNPMVRTKGSLLLYIKHVKLRNTEMVRGKGSVLLYMKHVKIL